MHIFYSQKKALEVAKMELRDEIVKIIQKDLVDRSFASEESFCSFIDHSLDEKLSQREGWTRLCKEARL